MYGWISDQTSYTTGPTCIVYAPLYLGRLCWKTTCRDHGWSRTEDLSVFTLVFTPNNPLSSPTSTPGPGGIASVMPVILSVSYITANLYCIFLSIGFMFT